MLKKKYRVLHVISELGDGGVEAMLMNLYRNVDKNKISFDFVVHSENKRYIDEINSLGGNVYNMKSMNTMGVIKYTKDLIKLIRRNGYYDAVHAHIVLQNGFILLAARIAGVKERVSHSHLTTYHRKITKIFSPIFKLLIIFNATKRVACGIEAGEHLYYSKNFTVLPNAIDVEKFSNAYKNLKLIKKYNISENTISIGFIGRLTEQKNPAFIIQLAKFIKENNLFKFKIFMVGTGHLQLQLENLIRAYGLDENVILLGSRNDIPELLKTFDLLILPSLYEGLPVILVEAQASGIPCVISNNITNEADLGLNLLRYVDLNAGNEVWINEIKKSVLLERPNKASIEKAMREKGYDISSSVLMLEDIYDIKFS